MFVNNAITDGINAYLKKKNNEDYPKAFYFELNIIEVLAKIYGDISLLNPYKLMDVDSLKNNLIVYGASTEEIEKLFNLLNEYKIWLNSTVREKNNIIKEIFEIISDLVIFKNKSVTINSEEMQYYEDFLSVKDPIVNQIVKLSSLNIDDVIKVWPMKLEESKKVPPKEEPLYLADEEYEKYGLFMDEVKKLPKEKVKELNKEIKTRTEKESNGNNGGNTKPWQLVLTSGNGYVDALVLFSIMCTELMIGIIVTIIIGRLS